MDAKRGGASTESAKGDCGLMSLPPTSLRRSSQSAGDGQAGSPGRARDRAAVVAALAGATAPRHRWRAKGSAVMNCNKPLRFLRSPFKAGEYKPRQC